MTTLLSKSSGKGGARAVMEASSVAARLESCLNEARWSDANQLIAQLDDAIAAEIGARPGNAGSAAAADAKRHTRLATLHAHCRACLDLTVRHGVSLAEQLRMLEHVRPALLAYHCVEQL